MKRQKLPGLKLQASYSRSRFPHRWIPRKSDAGPRRHLHYKMTSTPVGARLVYPNAFSVLMASDGDQAEDHAALLNAIRDGDILLFNGCITTPGAEKIKKLYGDPLMAR